MDFLILLALLISFAKCSYDATSVNSIERNLHQKIVSLESSQKKYTQGHPKLEPYFKYYSGEGYKGMADVLLKSTGTFVEKGYETKYNRKSATEYFDMAKSLNSAILELPRHDTPLTVYRSLVYAATKKTKVMNKYEKVGDIVPVTHLTSTTLSPFIGITSSQYYALKIEVPKDFPLRVIFSSGIYSEQEILLPYTLDPTGATANYGFKVMSVDKTFKKVCDSTGRVCARQKYIHLQIVNLDKPIPVNFKPEDYPESLDSYGSSNYNYGSSNYNYGNYDKGGYKYNYSKSSSSSFNLTVTFAVLGSVFLLVIIVVVIKRHRAKRAINKA